MIWKPSVTLCKHAAACDLIIYCYFFWHPPKHLHALHSGMHSGVCTYTNCFFATQLKTSVSSEMMPPYRTEDTQLCRMMFICSASCTLACSFGCTEITTSQKSLFVISLQHNRHVLKSWNIWHDWARLVKNTPSLQHYCVLGVSVSSSSSLCCPLSGSPCRLPPGSAGQLSASLYILHPGHLCVCGSALHPQQRKEVHHLWRLSAPRLWVFFILIPSVLFDLFLAMHFPLFILCPHWRPCLPQPCASWSQPPSTQTASTSTRNSVGTVTATSWRGSPSPSHSSPPSLTLCYARRLREKDTSSSSNQPKTLWLDLLSQLKSGFSHRWVAVYICLFWMSDLSCWCRFSYRYSRPVDPLKYMLLVFN